ncbi:BrnA antitoxin family protein [Jiella sonneratiae]|uniref:BrnA antitoxin family protein n=1 Tax=Jiella sonneratiae TaxID=2816856 RepID=A0ABS3J4E2_9HYPH|nr:BrnA antitoxin family protein [Jiella sonneratiae]MBO0904548.1 BrnA antitoxin family protein [Jiella sonneratiae]
MNDFGKTNFDRIDDDAELARQERDDPDLADVARDWFVHARLETGIPAPASDEKKQPVTIRLDPEILAFFRGQGRGWQTRINAVLKAFVTAQKSND